ncbi:MAG: general secretion pathway protein GspB [Deltaproteobacteria bacterium]|nr:general secretion pathway protein GspB [Deltaproteobacteria bacterium]MBW2165506.1 general secretion pathway protein GspB [Deltaproteobacteria bacterium]
MSSILKALKKLEQDADTTPGVPASIIAGSSDRPRIRPIIIQSLIIVTTIAIFAAIGFIISRPAISPRQSPAPEAGISQKTMEKAMLKTDQIHKESLPQQMVTSPSPSNESAKPVDTIEKPLTIPIHSDVSAPTEIIEINDEAGLKLQAISWSANVNKRIVVINGQICRVGERVNGYIVKQINPSDVIVSNESTSGKLSFKIR